MRQETPGGGADHAWARAGRFEGKLREKVRRREILLFSPFMPSQTDCLTAQMPKYPTRNDAHQSRQKKPYAERTAPPARKGPKPPPSAPVISKTHKEQQQAQQSQSLDLTGQSLSAPPNLAKEHPRLGKLNLTDCGLTSITWVSQVKNTLTWLNLSGNKLRDKSAWQGIEQLKTLFGESLLSRCVPFCRLEADEPFI